MSVQFADVIECEKGVSECTTVYDTILLLIYDTIIHDTINIWYYTIPYYMIRYDMILPSMSKHKIRGNNRNIKLENGADIFSSETVFFALNTRFFNASNLWARKRLLYPACWATAVWTKATGTSLGIYSMLDKISRWSPFCHVFGMILLYLSENLKQGLRNSYVCRYFSTTVLSGCYFVMAPSR